MTINVLGITSGIGSMLIPYHFDENLKSDCNVLGNVEWRKYYGETKLFELNFNSLYTSRQEDFAGKKIDIVMSHPECGAYSVLKSSGKTIYDGTESDIDDAYSKICESSPLLFSMDNLYKSLLTFGTDYIKEKMGEYDIFFEPVSNYHYGNVQKNRKRFFIIGAKKELGFVFQPGETFSDKTIENAIGDLPFEEDLDSLGHIHMGGEIAVSWKINKEGILVSSGETPMTYFELASVLMKSPKGTSIEYLSRKSGGFKRRIGFTINRENYPASTLFSGGEHGHPSLFHPYTCLPLTNRERARIQGFPDSYSLHMPHLGKMKAFFLGNKVTGKSMPVEFSRFTANQFVDFLKGEETQTSGKRFYTHIPEIISQNKLQYCKEVGYSNQEKACEFCWLKDNCSQRKSSLFSFFETPIDKSEKI